MEDLNFKFLYHSSIDCHCGRYTELFRKIICIRYAKICPALMLDYALNAMLWLFYALTYVKIWLNNRKKFGSAHKITCTKFYQPVTLKYVPQFFVTYLYGFLNVCHILKSMGHKDYLPHFGFNMAPATNFWIICQILNILGPFSGK